jgi:hypothetical protein
MKRITMPNLLPRRRLPLLRLLLLVSFFLFLNSHFLAFS